MSPATLQGAARLSMGFDIKGPTCIGDTIHVEIEMSEIRPTAVLVYTPLRMMEGR